MNYVQQYMIDQYMLRKAPNFYKTSTDSVQLGFCYCFYMLLQDNCWEKHRSKYKEFSEGTSKSDLLQQIKAIDADLLLLSTNTAMYFEIPVNMVKSQELIYLCAVSLALVTLSRCGSLVTVTEDEAVQLDFPYSCDCNKVTVQIANRLPFYNSEEPESLNLPSYQLHRFSVTDENCSVQVEINPVKRSDEATYICQAYRDSAIQSVLIRVRLNVNYPPGNVSCVLSISNDAVGDWMLLQCTAPIGSLAGGIYCYQDFKRLPPQSRLVKTGETLKQIIWVRKEHPIFCCSASIDKPKDMCECNDFVWNRSYTDRGILNPCPVTTAGQGAITKEPAERSKCLLLNYTVNPSTSKNVKSSTSISVSGIAILLLVTPLVIVSLYLCACVQECSLEHQKSKSFNSLKNRKSRFISWGRHCLSIERIYP